MQAKASLIRPAAIPAISKSTELRLSGQPFDSPRLSQFIIFPLDANSITFYSLPIFDALAGSANPVVLLRRNSLRRHPMPALPHPKNQSFDPVVYNPASPDGGQHTT